ncbi:MFS transporter [Bacillus salipaludis]|uniref:MFS transporter n=1 Tax=Bacillus salipaludis TaxID=2547811 RepID=A0A4R5VZV2_9BACI|nr:MFS transporter [Bacillus salipaludis]TDK64117.1 MFS transporter [Bacillus salipaludis]
MNNSSAQRISPEGQNLKQSKVRYLILTMLFIVTIINYIDRSALGIAAPVMREDLAFDAVKMGIAFSAFNWAYTIFNIPGGWLLDRFGARNVYGIALLLWSACTFFQGFITTLVGLFILRFLVGITEAPSFPGNSRLTTMWFPQHERGRAVSIYNSAQFFGLALFTPVMTWILKDFGWSHVFWVSGGAGIVMAILWFKFVREPYNHPRVNQAEIDYINSGGGLANEEVKRKWKWSDVRLLLTNRQMAGIYIGQYAMNTIVWFFLTWFPTYLVEEKGLTLIQTGFAASIPYVGAFFGGLFGGFISDAILKRGKSLAVARKTPIIAGFLLSSSIVLANYTSNISIIIIIMTVSFFAKGMAGITWSLVGDMAPKELVGLTGGIFNTIGNTAGIVTPLVIGLIFAKTHSFNGALIFVASIMLIGALSYIFIVNKPERLELADKK